MISKSQFSWISFFVLFALFAQSCNPKQEKQPFPEIIVDKKRDTIPADSGIFNAKIYLSDPSYYQQINHDKKVIPEMRLQGRKIQVKNDTGRIEFLVTKENIPSKTDSIKQYSLEISITFPLRKGGDTTLYKDFIYYVRIGE